MFWKGGRIVLVYAVALAVGFLIQFDKLEPWLAAQFENGPSQEWTLLASDIHRVRTGFGLKGAAQTLDWLVAGAFDDTYKNNFPSDASHLAGVSFPGKVYAASKPEPSAALHAPADELSQPSVEEAPVVSPGVPLALSSAVSPVELPIPPKPPVVPVEPLSPLPTPCNVLVVGDSLAIALAVPMEKAFKNIEGVTLVSKGKIASGLQNPQVIKWEDALRQFLKEYDPKLVVVMMGANDAKYLTLDHDSPTPLAVQDRRLSVYQARLEKFLAALDEKGVPSYWIGMPIMGDPDLAAKCQALNEVVRQACEATGHTRYLDTWSLLAGPDGGYANYLLNEKGTRIRVREGDKIHFSAAGGDIIVKAFLKDAGSLFEQTVNNSKDVATNVPAQENARPQ